MNGFVYGLYIKESQQILNDIAEEKYFELMEMEVDKDHIHLLVNYNPNQSLLDIVRLLKQISTYRIWRQNNNHIYSGKHFWNERTLW